MKVTREPIQNMTEQEYEEFMNMKLHHIPRWKRTIIRYIHKIFNVNYTPMAPFRLKAKGQYWCIKNGKFIKL